MNGNGNRFPADASEPDSRNLGSDKRITKKKKNDTCPAGEANLPKPHRLPERNPKEDDREEILRNFVRSMKEEGKSENTILKYQHDVRMFLEEENICRISDIGKEELQNYRNRLLEKRMPSGVNTAVSALNCFLKSAGKAEYCIRSVRIQQRSFRSPDTVLHQEEYFRLLKTAQEEGKNRLTLVMETMASTGIRVSELRYVTVESLQEGMFTVRLKGKVRTVVYPDRLNQKLRQYAERNHIKEGSIFVTRGGAPLNRSNIAHEMKALSARARVDARKIFPHNLRHLFAVTYYSKDKNVLHLADILGHSNLNTTRIYTSLSYREHLRIIDDLNLIT